MAPNPRTEPVEEAPPKTQVALAHDVPTLDAPTFDARGMAYALVGGVAHPPCVKPAAVAELRRSFAAEASDVFICTYPKCGTTWMQQIILLLLHDGDASKVKPHPALQSQVRPTTPGARRGASMV